MGPTNENTVCDAARTCGSTWHPARTAIPRRLARLRRVPGGGQEQAGGGGAGSTIRSNAGDTILPSADLVRYDADRKASEAISFGRDRIVGEAVFVPRTPDAAEDDGWYMAFVNDVPNDTTDLVVLDASAPTEGPVATVHLPARVPLGFHGNWIPTAS